MLTDFQYSFTDIPIDKFANDPITTQTYINVINISF